MYGINRVNFVTGGWISCSKSVNKLKQCYVFTLNTTKELYKSKETHIVGKELRDSKPFMKSKIFRQKDKLY